MFRGVALWWWLALVCHLRVWIGIQKLQKEHCNQKGWKWMMRQKRKSGMRKLGRLRNKRNFHVQNAENVLLVIPFSASF